MNELLEIFSLNFDAYLQGPMLLMVLVAIGLVVGILTGLFGVGGAFMISPILIILMGMNETLVVGSSLTFTIGTAAAGMTRHWRMKNVEVRTMLILIAGAMGGVMLGKSAHVGLRDALGQDIFAEVFRVLYLVMLLATAWVVHSNSKKSVSGKSLLQRMPIGPYIDLHVAGRKHTSLLGLVLVGMSIGLISGLLGIGGGVLFVPLLLVVVGLNTHLAIGTSLGVIAFSSVLGTILYSTGGNVNLLLVMTLLVGSSVGVQIGAWICQKLHAGKLQRYFVYIVLVAIILVAADLVKRHIF